MVVERRARHLGEAAPELVGIGAVAGIELQDDEPRHRQVAEVEAAAEPGLEQALGLVLAHRPRLGDARRRAGELGDARHVGLDVALRDRPDLDRHLALDRGLPLRRGGADELGRAGAERGEEGEDGDDADERPALGRVDRHQRRVAAERRR